VPGGGGLDRRAPPPSNARTFTPVIPPMGLGARRCSFFPVSTVMVLHGLIRDRIVASTIYSRISQPPEKEDYFQNHGVSFLLLYAPVSPFQNINGQFPSLTVADGVQNLPPWAHTPLVWFRCSFPDSYPDAPHVLHCCVRECA